MILRNQAECPECHDLVASWYRHDYKGCKCGGIDVDGGIDYLRRTYKKGVQPIERSISVENISLRGAKELLGILCAMPYEENITLVNLKEAVQKQSLKKPWFPDLSIPEIERWIERGSDLGFVEVGRADQSGRAARRMVPLAAWPGD